MSLIINKIQTKFVNTNAAKYDYSTVIERKLFSNQSNFHKLLKEVNIYNQSKDTEYWVKVFSSHELKTKFNSSIKLSSYYTDVPSSYMFGQFHSLLLNNHKIKKQHCREVEQRIENQKAIKRRLISNLDNDDYSKDDIILSQSFYREIKKEDEENSFILIDMFGPGYNDQENEDKEMPKIDNIANTIEMAEVRKYAKIQIFARDKIRSDIINYRPSSPAKKKNKSVLFEETKLNEGNKENKGKKYKSQNLKKWNLKHIQNTTISFQVTNNVNTRSLTLPKIPLNHIKTNEIENSKTFRNAYNSSNKLNWINKKFFVKKTSSIIKWIQRTKTTNFDNEKIPGIEDNSPFDTINCCQ